jgi:DNA-binding LacI/PurR family transcriptional regulator
MKPLKASAISQRGGPATIKDVAAKAGVSTATVSRVLTGVNGVRASVRRRVLQAVTQLDYHPNRLARSLRAGLRKVIGVIIPDLQNPFLTGVVHGVEAVLYDAGYTLVLGHSDSLAERERTHLNVLREEGAAGLILIPANAAGASYASLGKWDIPVVAVDRVPSGLAVDLVTTDNRGGVREAVIHLLSHDYRDIGFIGGPSALSVAQDRLAGFHDGLETAKGSLRKSYIMQGDFRQESGRLAMMRLFELAKAPRAVIVGNNLMTLGALQAIHERGIRIPEDIAIIGFDDMAWAASLRPALTAVAQPVEELGRTAAQLLLERLSTPGRPVRQVVLQNRLMLRHSCGCPPPSATPLASAARSELE